MHTVVVGNADGEMPELAGAEHGVVEKIGGLRAGMRSGMASVMLTVRLEDGRLVGAEVSMRHYMIAAAVFEAQYTDAERGGS